MQQIINKIRSFFTPVSIHEKLSEMDLSEGFISLAVNKNLSENTSMTRVIQLDGPRGIKTQYILSDENSDIRLKVYRRNKLIASNESEDSILNRKYINKISEVFHSSIDKGRELLKSDSKATSDIENEAKGLEWIKVSLVVLKSAVTKTLEDSELIFTGQYFCGQRDIDEHYQMRIQCLSLDFLLEFLNDGRLRISVWDYKNQEPNSQLTPTFSGEFVKVKQAVFDEFIQLLVLMSKNTTKIS